MKPVLVWNVVAMALGAVVGSVAFAKLVMLVPLKVRFYAFWTLVGAVYVSTNWWAFLYAVNR